MHTKKCQVCQRVLDPSQFGSDGGQERCRDCDRKRAARDADRSANCGTLMAMGAAIVVEASISGEY